MTVSKFWRPRPITNHILPLFKIKAVFYLFQSLSKPLLAFHIYCRNMLICPKRENTNWFLQVWSIIFLVPSQPHLSSNQWSLLSISPGGHLTINALVVVWDNLSLLITRNHLVHHLYLPCPGLLRISCPSPFPLGTIAHWKAEPGPSVLRVSTKNLWEDVSTDIFRAKLYSWSSRESCPLSWGRNLHDDFSGQNWVQPTAVKCGMERTIFKKSLQKWWISFLYHAPQDWLGVFLIRILWLLSKDKLHKNPPF